MLHIMRRPADVAALHICWTNIQRSRTLTLPEVVCMQEVMRQLADAAKQVEAALGGQPQDIEGVWADGKVTVVQSRPQVLN